MSDRDLFDEFFATGDTNHDMETGERIATGIGCGIFLVWLTAIALSIGMSVGILYLIYLAIRVLEQMV